MVRGVHRSAAQTLYGLRSGGSRIALYLGLIKVGERVIELADSAIDWNFNIDTVSAASTDVWKVISGRKNRSALTEIKLLVQFHHQ